MPSFLVRVGEALRSLMLKICVLIVYTPLLASFWMSDFKNKQEMAIFDAYLAGLGFCFCEDYFRSLLYHLCLSSLWKLNKVVAVPVILMLVYVNIWGWFSLVLLILVINWKLLKFSVSCLVKELGQAWQELSQLKLE